jgi:hypothetical protein
MLTKFNATYSSIILRLNMRNKKQLILILFSVVCFATSPGIIWGESIGLRVDSSIDNGVVHVEVQTLIEAPHNLIWEVLTDYNRLAEYIPGMRSSRLLRYEGQTAFVEQHGVSEFLFFKIPIDVIVKTIEVKPYSISIELVSGNLDHLSGGYRLTQVGDEDLWGLSWSGFLDPSLPIPSFIAERFIRNNIKSQFLGIIAQIEKEKRRSGNYADSED